MFEDVERLARNLVAMNGILRDRERTTVRLVMNPDRMVVKEAMRTFTYLNLYGYLTDAVMVNRVLPEEAADGLLRATGASASRSTWSWCARASRPCRSSPPPTSRTR